MHKPFFPALQAVPVQIRSQALASGHVFVRYAWKGFAHRHPTADFFMQLIGIGISASALITRKRARRQSRQLTSLVRFDAGTTATLVAEQIVCMQETPAEERRLLQALLAKHRADDNEAWFHLALTLFLYCAALCFVHITGGNWIAIAFLALSQIRTFLVFHDAAHLSFFEKAEANRTLASILQFFTNYSYAEWDAVHNSHHAHFGDQTVKDNSLTIWFSEQELSELPWYLQLCHRIFRDPLIFYPFASFFVFFANKPISQGLYRVAVPLAIWCMLGSQTAVAYLLAAWLAGGMGVAAFHLQHHFNSPYRVGDSLSRTHMDAAMMGSSRIEVPFPLSIFTFGIEYHHIHHFDVRVPGYRLGRCDAAGQAQGLWSQVNTLDGLRIIRSLCHTQFQGSTKFREGETRPRFVSFWPYSAFGLQDC